MSEQDTVTLDIEVFWRMLEALKRISQCSSDLVARADAKTALNGPDMPSTHTEPQP